MKLWIKTIGPDNKKYEFVFDTSDYTKTNDLMLEHPELIGHTLLDWKLKNIQFLNI